jgi:predicted nucleic acid-binding protein
MGEDMRHLLDTNVVIDYVQGNFPDEEIGLIEGLIFQNRPNISFITEIELLCWNHAKEDDVEQYKKFIANSKVIRFNDGIRQETINIRKNHRIKFADALIAATALFDELELVTRNAKDFEGIEDLRVKNPWNLRNELHWSQELQDLTREVLSDPDKMLGWAMMPNKSGVFKNIDGRHGFMKFGNAVGKKWIINLESGGTENFVDLNSLLKAGWAVD